MVGHFSFRCAMKVQSRQVLTSLVQSIDWKLCVLLGIFHQVFQWVLQVTGTSREALSIEHHYMCVLILTNSICSFMAYTHATRYWIRRYLDCSIILFGYYNSIEVLEFSSFQDPATSDPREYDQIGLFMIDKLRIFRFIMKKTEFLIFVFILIDAYMLERVLPIEHEPTRTPTWLSSRFFSVFSFFQTSPPSSNELQTSMVELQPKTEDEILADWEHSVPEEVV